MNNMNVRRIQVRMTHPMVRLGWATLLCAIFTGVGSAGLQDATVVDDVIVIDQPDTVVHHVRRLSTNSTDDQGLATGSIVAIIVGGVAAAVLVLGAFWWWMCRRPPSYTPAGSYAPVSPFVEMEVPNAQAVPPDFFRASASGGEIPMLRLPMNGC